MPLECKTWVPGTKNREREHLATPHGSTGFRDLGSNPHATKNEGGEKIINNFLVLRTIICFKKVFAINDSKMCPHSLEEMCSVLFMCQKMLFLNM